jgi:hypothetical protein
MQRAKDGTRRLVTSLLEFHTQIFLLHFPSFRSRLFFAFEALLGGDKETLNGLAIAGFSRNRQCAQSLGSIARAEGDKGQQMRFLTPRSPADRALITRRALCVYARARTLASHSSRCLLLCNRQRKPRVIYLILENAERSLTVPIRP